MSSFNGKDYDRVLELAKHIFHEGKGRASVVDAAIELMVMVEGVRGQQVLPLFKGPHRDIYLRKARLREGA
jgi:hypothetical protein